MSQRLFIFTISYEGSLFSYEFKLGEGVISPFFNCKDHVGRIKAVHATTDGLVLTSGEDENIKVYNFLKRKTLSNIYGTSGVCLKLLSSVDFALSCHENGMVYVEGKRDFAIYHKLKVFKDSCIDFDLHPSNKLMVCLNNKGRFAVWNLSVCTMIFHRKIKASVQMVRFLNDDSLLLITESSIYCFSMKLLEIVSEIKAPSNTKINDCVVVREPKLLIAIGCENGCVYFYGKENFDESIDHQIESYIGFKAYNYRVKKISIQANYLITVSTEGDISIWDISEIQATEQISGSAIIESYSAIYEYKVSSRLVGLSCVIRNDKKVKNTHKGEIAEKQDMSSIDKQDIRVTRRLRKHKKISKQLNK